jgi:hypothetical protein
MIQKKRKTMPMADAKREAELGGPTGNQTVSALSDKFITPRAVSERAHGRR